MVRAWLVILALLMGMGISFAAGSDSILASDKRWAQAREELAQGKAAEAKADFEKLLAVYPNEADLHLFLGMALLRLRDPSAAEAAAKRAVALNPRHVDARTFLAWIELEVRGDIDGAIGDYQKVIEMHPELPEAYSNLAVAQKRKGDFPGAVASLNRALELRPDFSSALTTRGGIFAEQNRWAEAERDFAAARALYERALDLDNLAEAVYRRLMVCQRELGDPAGALTTYRRCRELLSIVLGRKPAAETEAIRATLDQVSRQGAG